jgi:hypothetical protein
VTWRQAPGLPWRAVTCRPRRKPGRSRRRDPAATASALPSRPPRKLCLGILKLAGVARQSGLVAMEIIMRIPSKAPSNPTRHHTRYLQVKTENSKGQCIVTPRPKAIDSPPEPAVCTMLFSKIVASLPPILGPQSKKCQRNHRHWYRSADCNANHQNQVQRGSPKMTPRSVPIISARGVNSGHRYVCRDVRPKSLFSHRSAILCPAYVREATSFTAYG